VAVPPAVSLRVDSLFEAPAILDVWRDNLAVWVAVCDGGVYCQVVFSFAYEWFCTFRNIAEADLGAEIRERFRGSAYGGCAVDQVRMLEDEGGVWYLFYFCGRDGKRHILYLKENGGFDCLVSY
jgi:hypothetical protein